nr:sigma factor-like helix-turn-helix DNA-binding protein [Ureibacillus terrenus]
MEHKQELPSDSLHLGEALSKLNESYQTSIILFYYHDLSIRDIAEVMGKPVGTIKTYLRRAKKHLKNELERSYKFNERTTFRCVSASRSSIGDSHWNCSSTRANGWKGESSFI